MLEEGLTHLTQELRDAVLLHDVVGMNTEEAAAALRLERAAFRSRLHEGRIFLRDYIDHATSVGLEPGRETGASLRPPNLPVAKADPPKDQI